MKFLLSFVALCVALTSTAVIAAPVAPDRMLVASMPAEGGMQKGSVETISLKFAEAVELLNVSLMAPDGSEQLVFAASFEPDAPKAKGKAFDFSLATPATAPGRYSISYLLTSKSIKSLNGYVYFEIAGPSEDVAPASEPIAPEPFEATPAQDVPDGDLALVLSTSST